MIDIPYIYCITCKTKYLSLKAHESVLNSIDFFRMAVQKAKEWNDHTDIELNFKIYSQNTLKLFMDMVYGVNVRKINLMEMIDIIILILGYGN